MVFDTIDESFRHIRAPVVPGRADVFEMDGMLGLSSFNDAATTINIWVLQNYESEAWTFKFQIVLPLMEIRSKCENHDDRCNVVVVRGNDKLLVLVKFSEWMIEVDMDGKVVNTFHRKDLRHTQFQLKQSLVQHAFFPRMRGYVVNRVPFI